MLHLLLCQVSLVVRTCEKCIPLSVMKSLEIWLQLDNVASVLKYQFVPFSAVEGCTKTKNASINVLNNISCAKIDSEIKDSKWEGQASYVTHAR